MRRLTDRIIGAAVALVQSCVMTTACCAAVNEAPVLSRPDLEAWLDGYFPYALQRGDVAGAVIVVVKDGRVLLQKGYGYADMQSRHGVDPQTTMFRPGSVSKLFTWTAVMQQVEKGRLDLDQDVNHYLDFHIPDLNGQPLTLRHLMTHTPGFEYSLRDLVTTESARRMTLADYLKQRLPARIFRPGEIPAYSNYGAALAGYIVQRVSGQSFDAYVEKEIFAPLGMRNSTFRQPLPTSIPARMSTGYERASEDPRPFEYLIAPAGGASVTGADMGNFMLAYLQLGELRGQRILQDATVRQVLQPGVKPIRAMQHTMRLGFFDFERNGHRIVGHEGDTIWYHSVLQLYPDDHVGLFLSMNSSGNDSAARSIRAGLLEGFADRYFPSAAPLPRAALQSATSHAAMLAGAYESSQQEPNGFLSLVKLMTQSAVTANPDGTVSVSSIRHPGGQVRSYQEMAPFVWREVDGPSRLAARMEAGRVVLWARDDSAADEIYLPVPWWRDARWLLPAVVGSIAVLLLTVLVWPIAHCVRRRWGTPFSLQGAAARGYRRVRLGAAAAGVLFLIWFILIGTMVTKLQVSSAMVPWIMTLHVASNIVFPFAAAVALWNAAITCWWRWNAVLAIGCLTLLWAAVIYHLVGFGAQF